MRLIVKRVQWHFCCLLGVLVTFITVSPSATAIEKPTMLQIATIEKEPYSGQTLPQFGYANEIIAKSFLISGADPNFTFFPISRAERFTETGYMDVYGPVREPQKNKHNKFIYSDPFPGGMLSKVKKANRVYVPKTGTINSCFKRQQSNRRLHLGIVRGTFDQEYLPKDCYSQLPAVSDLQIVEMLAADRVDLLLMDKFTAADLIVHYRPHLIGNLEVISDQSSAFDFRIAVSRQHESVDLILDMFNQGLATLKSTGQFDTIMHKHGLYLNQTQPDKKTSLVIGVPNINQIQDLQKVVPLFMQKHPGLNIEFRVLEENILRRRLLSDMAISDGQYDVVMLGGLEAKNWGKRGWLVPFDDLPTDYDKQDFFGNIVNLVEDEKHIYALPFIGERSATYYRQDLLEENDLEMPMFPTYDKLLEMAKQLHDPENQVFGIGMRGISGWGQNIAFITTMANSYGAIWFDQDWNPQMDSDEWIEALSFYRRILSLYGPPNYAENGWQENQRLFEKGHLAILIDSTALAGHLFNPKKSQVADKIKMVKSPHGKRKLGASWLWTWAVGVPSSSKNQALAKQFATWVTSKDYIQKVGELVDLKSMPPGTRRSTYSENYVQQNAYAKEVLDEMTTLEERTKNVSLFNDGMRTGSLPEFPAIGYQVGLIFQRVLKQQIGVEEGVKLAQETVLKIMTDAGYYSNAQNENGSVKNPVLIGK